MSSANSISKKDIERIESTLEKMLEITESTTITKDYIEVLKQLAGDIKEIKLQIDFDIERRLRAIEDFLQYSNV